MQGVQLDASSAGALHESLQALRQHEDQDLLKIMQLLVTKPMQVCLSGPTTSALPWGIGSVLAVLVTSPVDLQYGSWLSTHYTPEKHAMLMLHACTSVSPGAAK